MQASCKFHRIKSVKVHTGLGKTSIYELIKADLFPAPVKIGKRAVAWREEDLEQWLNERPSSLKNSYKGDSNV